VGIVLSIAHSINIRLSYLQKYLNKLALKPNDLSVSLQISGNDEVTDISLVFNQFIANFKATFRQIPAYSRQPRKRIQHK